MFIGNFIRKPLSVLQTFLQTSCSVFHLRSAGGVQIEQKFARETGSRPDQASEAFERGQCQESVELVVTVEPEMETPEMPQTTNNDTSAQTTLLENVLNISIFQRNETKPSEHKKFDRAYNWSFLVFCFAAVVTIAALQIRQHNGTASYLHQTNTTVILDSSYICDCNLPSNLVSLQKTPNEIPLNNGLKRCYRKEDLSTITVVQFNNDTAYDVAQTLNDLSPKNISHTSNQKGWFFLEQDTTELVLWTGTDNGTLASICNGVPYLDTVFTFALTNPSLSVYFDYPLQYTRMALNYSCSDCSVCSPEKIMRTLGRNNTSFLLPINQWVECSGFGNDTSPRLPCKAAQSYNGRCNLYPVFDISMSTRLNQLLRALTAMSPHLTIMTQTADGKTGIEMHANVLYYNKSSVVERNDVTYAYFQVDPSTDLIWPILVSRYPNLANSAGSCKARYMKNYEVPVCNGTSICNVYKELGPNGVSTPTLNCIDFSQNYSGCLLMAHASGNEHIVDKLCKRKSPSCQSVLPYQVKYPSRDLSQIPLDTKIVSSIMNNSWLNTYTNGVCSIQYADVLPFTLRGRQVFLEMARTQDLYTITGNYSVVNDTADTPPRPVEESDWNTVKPYLIPNYVCYKFTTVPWYLFAITLLGTIGGWLTPMYTFANMLYSPCHDRWDAWCKSTSGSGGWFKRSGSVKVVPDDAGDDWTNGDSNAGSDSGRYGQDPNTASPTSEEAILCPHMEPVSDSDTMSSNKPMRQRSRSPRSTTKIIETNLA